MKYAVEQCFFDNGAVRVKVRQALEGEQNHNEERTRCDFYVDIFDTIDEARAFARDAKNA